jgi:hypothetical protein
MRTNSEDRGRESGTRGQVAIIEGGRLEFDPVPRNLPKSFNIPMQFFLKSGRHSPII